MMFVTEIARATVTFLNGGAAWDHRPTAHVSHKQMPQSAPIVLFRGRLFNAAKMST